MDVLYSHIAGSAVKGFFDSVWQLACIAGRGNFCQRLVLHSSMSTKTAIISVADLKPDNLPALRKALETLPGVSRVDFNLDRSVAVLEFDPSQSHIDDFLRAVLKAGFKVL